MESGTVDNYEDFTAGGEEVPARNGYESDRNGTKTSETAARFEGNETRNERCDSGRQRTAGPRGRISGRGFEYGGGCESVSKRVGIMLRFGSECVCW